MPRRLSFLFRVSVFVAVVGIPLKSQTVISGTYNGASISGDIIVNPSTTATFTGGTTFSGANATLGTSATLHWQQTGPLTGPKAFTFGTGSLLYLDAANAALTF